MSSAGKDRDSQAFNPGLAACWLQPQTNPSTSLHFSFFICKLGVRTPSAYHYCASWRQGSVGTERRTQETALNEQQGSSFFRNKKWVIYDSTQEVSLSVICHAFPEDQLSTRHSTRDRFTIPWPRCLGPQVLWKLKFSDFWKVCANIMRWWNWNLKTKFRFHILLLQTADRWLRVKLLVCLFICYFFFLLTYMWS